jgi:deazaflavin-dependent oxidoreductase (nitroreductase family)
MTDAKDSAIGWVAKHTQQYVETDGREGHRWNGVDTLVLTTTGRRTGDKRRNALIYGTDGDRYVVVGSFGGSDRHPLWFHNLSADPQVDVQVGSDKFAATARLATGDERSRLWAMMAEVFPTYLSYQEKTSREIPVVVLERVS